MRREIDESMLEVIKLLQEKNRKKKDKADRAKSAQEAFTQSAARFIADTLETLTPLNPYGITCIKERTNVTCDFGEGEIEVELDKLLVKDGIDTIVTLEPFCSKTSSNDRLRFRAIHSKIGTRTVIQNPPPFAMYMGWHMWVNEDHRSAEPEYLKINKEGWMAIIKDHLLANVD